MTKPTAKTTASNPADSQAEFFKKYISDKTILIADASASARASLARTLITMGAKIAHIALAANFQAAEEEIRKRSPHVVLCDFDLGPRCGLDLLQTMRSVRPETRECLFVLVTANTSQSAVAQAAEEDIDTFVLKPYTMGVLRNSILRAATAKLKPSPYVRMIEEGKQLLFSVRLPEAIATFEKAMALDPKPSLAWFYHGQARLMQQAVDSAQEDYLAGLEFNKIHYKCMVGLFDILNNRKMYAEAYEVIKKIARYFPANPQRLNTVVRLAIVTRSYEDIERYYQVFTSLEDRNEDLVRYICAALVVCGKFYLQKNSGSRALELFEKAAATASGRVRILREIILALLQFDLPKEAREFLKRFPPEAQSSPSYLSLQHAIEDRLNTASLSIEQGRALIQRGVHDPLIYLTLIRRSREQGLEQAADDLERDACARWPEQKTEFERASRISQNDRVAS